MVLALDASSPAITDSDFLGNSPASLTSHSFSPPANAVIAVTVMGWTAFGPSGYTAVSVADSLGSHLTWTAGPLSDAVTTSTYCPGTFTFWAVTGSTAPGSMTVTGTLTAGAGQTISAMSVAVNVWTGAKNAGPLGANKTGQFTGAALSASLTPTANGSALMMAAVDGEFVSIAAGSGFFMRDASSLVAGQEWFGASGGPTLTTTLTARNMLLTMSSTSVTNYVAYEVLAAASGGVSATGTGAIAFGGSGTATVVLSTSGTGAIAFAGAGTATAASGATGSGAIAFAGSGTAKVTVSATGSGAVAFAGAGTATLTVTASGTGALSFAGSGVISASGVVNATGAGVVTFGGSGAATVTVSTTGAGGLAFAGTGTATVVVTFLATGTGALVFGGSGRVGKPVTEQVTVYLRQRHTVAVERRDRAAVTVERRARAAVIVYLR